MKTIYPSSITKAVSELCIRANHVLRDDVLQALKLALRRESDKKAKRIFKAILENAAVAKKERLAICQDTGLPTVFVELGQEVRIKGDLRSALAKGVEEGYRRGFLRSSIVRDPLARTKPGYLPPIMHIDIVKGKKLKLTVLPKGFGCENKTQLKMFLPTACTEEIKQFIVAAVKAAGPDACPPYVVGVGIGGTADYACLLAKKALLCRITHNARRTTQLERDVLREINQLRIGPMGLGGKTTALAVNILTYPTHIAGLPVAVNISCHALRSATTTLCA
ncbi:MAG: fumarate hydratase [Candidatus Omnitrophota bacterium]|jgi:fumarate hydratase subunit alpha|nr:MAG: fumarate hydratase [Candidatus Omnitrophota bacterium]